MDEDRDRSSISGQFVSDEYADEHPDTTVSEVVGDESKERQFRDALDALKFIADPDESSPLWAIYIAGDDTTTAQGLQAVARAALPDDCL
jgi:hypothetical protein